MVAIIKFTQCYIKGVEMNWEETVIPPRELLLIKDGHVIETGEDRPDIKEYVDEALERQSEITWNECIEEVEKHLGIVGQGKLDALKAKNGYKTRQ